MTLPAGRPLSAENLEILKLFGRYPKGIVMVSLIDDILRPEGIACFLFKLFQYIGTDAGTIAKPIHEFLPGIFVNDQRKLMEEDKTVYPKAFQIYALIIASISR